ncbi:4317_t:CDS:2, partial [Gigaspora rosea]
MFQGANIDLEEYKYNPPPKKFIYVRSETGETGAPIVSPGPS